MIKTSGRQLTIDNFSLMKKGSQVYYAENMGIEKYGYKNVLIPKNEGSLVFDSSPGIFGDIEQMDGIDMRVEGTTNYFWIISDGRIYLKSASGSRDGDGRVIAISNAGTYPNIKCMGMGENGKIIFSYISNATGAMLGRIHTGEATGGTATTLVDNGVDFTTLNLVNGDTVYNITDGGSETITNITAHTLTITGGTPFSSGDEYCIVDPNWQTMDANAEHDWGQQIIEFDESFYILNGSWLDVVDSAGAHSNKTKALEAEWIARTGVSNGDTLAIGANKNFKGKIFIWDKHSIGWRKKIAIDNEVQSITDWGNNYIYIAGNSLWITDGYNIRKLSDFPFINEEDEFEVKPMGMMTVGNKVIINGGAKDSQLSKNGIWIYDIDREEWALNPYDPDNKGNKISYNVEGGIVVWNGDRNEVFYSFVNSTLCGWDDPYLFSSFDFGDTSKRGTTIFEPIRLGKGAKVKKIEVNLVSFHNETEISASPSKTISCKLSDCKRPIWLWCQAEADSLAKDKIKVDGTDDRIASAKIGDEVFIANGWNGHLRRKIISWENRGTNTEEWTLDSELDELTQNNTSFFLMPFQEYGMIAKTITEAGMLEFYPNFFGDNVMVEIEITGETSPKVAIQSVKLYYE